MRGRWLAVAVCAFGCALASSDVLAASHVSSASCSARQAQPPLVSATSTPQRGATVHAGEAIAVQIVATEPANDGPKDAVHDIQLSGPAGLVKSADYAKQTVACTKSSTTKTLSTTYTVPAKPPSMIHLSAVADNFAGQAATVTLNFPVAKRIVTRPSSPESTTLPQGSKWAGSFDLAKHSICPVTSTGTMHLTVTTNGHVKGVTAGHYTRNDHACNVPDSGASAFTGEVVGTATTKQFTLTLYMLAPAAPTVINDPLLVMPVTIPLTSRNAASGQGTDYREPSAEGPIYRTYSISLTCKTCST